MPYTPIELDAMETTLNYIRGLSSVSISELKNNQKYRVGLMLELDSLLKSKGIDPLKYGVQQSLVHRAGGLFFEEYVAKHLKKNVKH